MMGNENLLSSGVVTGFDGSNTSFAIVSDGIFECRAYINKHKNVVVGKSYLVYKVNSIYFLGAELQS
jgi:hypothetical protein